MAKGRFFYNNCSKKYTLTATTEIESAEVENVLTPYPFNVWRSDSNGVQYVTFSSATSRNVLAVYIGNHNLSSFTTFEVQASNNDFTDHDDYNITSIYETRERTDSDNEVESFTYRSGYALITGGAYTDYRIKIDSSVSYYEIGFIGLYTGDYTFAQNWLQSFRWGWKTVNRIIESNYGNTNIKQLYQRREGGFQFKYISDTQNTILTRTIPLNNAVVFAPDGLSQLYLVGVYHDDIAENLFTIADDKKTIELRFVEHI